MLRSYNNFLLEKNDFRNRIQKFIKIPKLVELAHKKSPKFSVWLANVYKDKLIKYLKPLKEYKHIDIDNIIKNGPKTDEEKSLIDSSINIIENDMNNKLTEILDWLNSPLRDEKINLKELSFEKALEKSIQWHYDLKSTGEAIENETGKIIMEFNDGYYWIDLETDNCEDEGKAMGHCANTEADTLLSLRDSKKRPHITVAFDYGGEIYQIKGKENKKPIEKYHKYIIELIKSPNVNKDFVINLSDDISDYIIRTFGSEYNPKNDFHLSDLHNEQISDIINSNSKLELTFSLLYILYKMEIKDGKEFEKKWDDMLYENGNFYIIFKEWDEIKNFFNDDWWVSILNGDGNFFINEYNFDFDYFWDELLPKTHKEIIKDIIKNEDKFKFFDNDNYTKQYSIINKNMIYYDDERKDSFVKYDGKEYKLKKILNESDNEITSKLDLVYNRAKEIASESEAHNYILDKIESRLGKISINSGEKWVRKININYIMDDISEGENNSNENANEYSSIIDYISHLIDENIIESIDIDEPRYGWNGIIKPEDFHEEYIQYI